MDDRRKDRARIGLRLSLIWLCLLPGGIGPLSALQTAPALGEEPKSAAEQARADGRLLAAVQLYQAALAREPGWIDGWWALGAIQFELDRYNDAARSFEKVLERRPDDAEVQALLGLSDFETGNLDRAAELLTKAVAAGIGRIEPLGEAVTLRYGMLLARQGEFERALSVLGALALRGRYDRPLLREAFGVAALRITRLPQDVPPELREPVLLAGRAMALVFANQPDDAAPVFRELVRRFPDVPNVHFAYANFLTKADSDLALEQYRVELQRDSQHLPSLLEVAFEQLRRGNASAALEPAEQSVKLAPDSFASRLALGRVQLALGRVEAAVRELELAVRLASDSPDAHFALAQAYRASGREAESRKELQEFQRLKDLRDQSGGQGVRQ